MKLLSIKYFGGTKSRHSSSEKKPSLPHLSFTGQPSPSASPLFPAAPSPSASPLFPRRPPPPPHLSPSPASPPRRASPVSFPPPRNSYSRPPLQFLSQNRNKSQLTRPSLCSKNFHLKTSLLRYSHSRKQQLIQIIQVGFPKIWKFASLYLNFSILVSSY